MTALRIFLLVIATSIAACGKAPAPESTSAPAADTAAAPTDSSAPIAAPAPADATDDESAPAATAVEESAGTEAAASAAGDKLGKEIVLAGNTAPVTDWKYQEGKHFTTLTAAQGTSSTPGKIEVAEVFWYGCSHCYSLEPLLQEWVKRLPADVSFVRIPVMWNPTNEINGRIYYTGEALGKVAQIDAAVFKAIHVDNRPLTEESAIKEFFVQNGVSAEDFDRTFRSFSVESQLKRAKDLTVKYRVRGVPLLVVNGKFSTNGPEIRSHQDLLAVADELIQRERQKN